MRVRRRPPTPTAAVGTGYADGLMAYADGFLPSAQPLLPVVQAQHARVHMTYPTKSLHACTSTWSHHNSAASLRAPAAGKNLLIPSNWLANMVQTTNMQQLVWTNSYG